jgi:hypothetical protein
MNGRQGDCGLHVWFMGIVRDGIDLAVHAEGDTVLPENMILGCFGSQDVPLPCRYMPE